MTLWEWAVAIILGVVEGLTEFAPISSTGHMIIVDDLWLKSAELLRSTQIANTFKIVIQLGSILAVVVLFRERFARLLNVKNNPLITKGKTLTLGHIGTGLLPAIVLGFLFEDFIDKHLFSIETVIIGLIAGSFLMIAADFAGKRKPAAIGLDEISYPKAFLIGLFQCIALWPGFSRSGSTISGGVILGLNHRAAADFTFIMAVPIMLGASILSLIKHADSFSMDFLPFFITGFVTAFIFALLSIQFFLIVISKIKLVPFAIYRLVLAAVLIVVLYF
ncbi:undecaprenyl-diphosphate phosphatase [Jeotgalibacillus proteolyticus]|uniref:Undecaprenyl-diphosphatase n=1 Tax=Jeotgalibacillus proteolyticus TaxID=2082395 RepID=A0A2S5GDU0_9BACL|nr:undecaprenyl-diphosphate phosphatase [Jeotgalibacillus proteolyticus]PPA71159.1 undecaprenyl-diphosphatase [Jeotgalibacillus proteolyticus]